MLRNPVDMLHSLHSEFLRGGNEDIDDFEAALNAEEDRKRGIRIPRGAFIQGLYYRDTAKYANQVKRYYDTFGRDYVHIIIFDDFKSNTPGVYKDTLRFLDVDGNFRPVFKLRNPNKAVRSRILLNLTYRPPKVIVRLSKILFPERARRVRILKSLRRVNTKLQPRPPMSSALKRQLQAEFRAEVERLSELIGRDLTHWSKPDPIS